MKNINGWLNLYKEKSITSHDLVYKVRKKLQTKKVGHAGTLDPMATGTMVIAVGKATRLIQFLKEVKAYRAGICFGITTSTLDAEGEVTSQQPVPEINEAEILETLKKFTGKIKQIPPMVSALHHNGVRLYKLAREGIEVERQPREIEIYKIEMLNFELPKLEIEVHCQSGTYIRTLADDIGREYGCGAYLTSLERISSNEAFLLEDSLEVEDITEDNLLPLDFPLAHLPEVCPGENDIRRYLQGQVIPVEKDFQGDFCRVYDQNRSLVGIGKNKGRYIQPYINLA